MSVVISGTGSYVPEIIVGEEEFLQHEFYNSDGSRIDLPNKEIIRKFRSITGIEERRYAPAGIRSSDMAAAAAAIAIADAGIDKESLDGIIYAHNYGDIPKGTIQSDTVPSLAARVKHTLKIKSPDCIAFDILFGCPGWIQGVITARQYITGSGTKRYLVIGAETLSRVLDPHDRDSMIYADGAGAAIVEEKPGAAPSGILSTASRSYTYDEAYYLDFGHSLKEGYQPDTRFIKMQGRKIYEFALTNVPQAMRACLDKSGCAIDEVKKVFIHQANEKMDEAIIKRFFKLYERETPENIMPMSINKLGNSSVATVPTLFDLVRKNKLEGHHIETGDLIILASVGAGMNINAITYRI